MVSIGNGWIRPMADPSENVKHYYNILIVVAFFFVAQLLICAWDQPFWAAGLEFPGQIVAMVSVWLFVWAAQVLFCEPGEGIDKFYHKFLRAPTEVLNKHMSIGFTVPFLNLISHSLANSNQVGLLVAAFVVTGVLNSIVVYFVAYHVQLTTTKMICCLRCSPVPDVEAARTQTKVADSEPPQAFAQIGTLRHDGECTDDHLGGGANEASRRDRFQKHISDASTLCTVSGYVSDSNASRSACKGNLNGTYTSQNYQCQTEDIRLQSRDRDVHGASTLAVAEISALSRSPPSRVRGVIYAWLSQNVCLALSLLILFIVGVPLSVLHNNDLYLDAGFLFTVWLTFTSAQLRTKQHTYPGHRHRNFLTAVATLLNPVLWTSLFLVCYGLAKSSIRNQPGAAVIAGFTTKNTVSDLIAHHHHLGHPAASTAAAGVPRLGPIPFGAGDVATSVLNAGIVSWGLKLFEYRHQIVSSGGLTVVATSLLASLLNVVAWPLLAHSIGVRPASWGLSFAARSVTIALGGPAMRSLGGDAGINAVGVVANGICFQLLAGFFPGGEGLAAAAGRLRRACVHDGWAGLVWNGGAAEDRELESLAPSRGRGGVPCEGPAGEGLQPGHRVGEIRYSSDATHVGDQRVGYQNDVFGCGTTCSATNNDSKNSNSDSNKSRMGKTTGTAPEQDDDGPQAHGGDTAPDPLTVVPTVAAGVTIGINAAAMGTAHLYEHNSHAAPYSALSMTMFGVFTVLFAVRGPITEWLARTVGGGGTQAAVML